MDLNIGGRVKGGLVGSLVGGLLGLPFAPFTGGMSILWGLGIGGGAGALMPDTVVGGIRGAVGGGFNGMLWGGLGGAALLGIAGLISPIPGGLILGAMLGGLLGTITGSLIAGGLGAVGGAISGATEPSQSSQPQGEAPQPYYAPPGYVLAPDPNLPNHKQGAGQER